MRNPLHKHPLMRKGGVHQKTNKELRKQEKQNLKKEWPYQSLFLLSQFCLGHSYVISIAEGQLADNSSSKISYIRKTNIRRKTMLTLEPTFTMTNYTELIREDAVRDLLDYLNRPDVEMGDVIRPEGVQRSAYLEYLLDRLRNTVTDGV